MKILLTGCAGFIGARVAEFLLRDGVSVVGVDNLNDYYNPKLKEFRLGKLKELSDKFVFHKEDIGHRAFLEDLFAKNSFDAVYNLAARAGVRASLECPEVYISTNISGTLNLLECMRKYGVKKFILTSTSALYAGQPMPFVETLSVNQPISPYAASKKAAEMLCYTYHHLYGIDVSILRCFTVYGPNGRPDMSPDKFMKCIASNKPLPLNGDGMQSRDFTYVDDVARGVIAAQKPLDYEVINLGNEHPYTICEMIDILEKFLNKKAIIEHHPFNASDMKHTFADIRKAKQLLDWQPTIELPDGLRMMVEDAKFEY